MNFVVHAESPVSDGVHIPKTPQSSHSTEEHLCNFMSAWTQLHAGSLTFDNAEACLMTSPNIAIDANAHVTNAENGELCRFRGVCSIAPCARHAQLPS